MIKLSLCVHCYDKIHKKNSSYAETWVLLCELFYKIGKELIFVKPLYYKDLRELEIMKYILTTDTADAVAIKLLGHEKKQSDELIFFCGGRCEDKNL